MFLFIPIGFEDPVICNEIKWIIIIAIKMKGKRKCNIKNRFSVAFLTENPPHNHSTISFPMYGIADTKFVITVAPQKDICPHGRTYPIKAVPIIIKRIDIPDHHVYFNLNEEKIIPRLMWMYSKINNVAAPFMCINRNIHPIETSRVMWITEENAISTLGW